MVIISEHNYIKGSDSTTTLGTLAGLGVIVFLIFLVFVKNKGFWWYQHQQERSENSCEEGCPPASDTPKSSSAVVPSKSVYHITTPKNKLTRTNSFHGTGCIGRGESSSETEIGVKGKNLAITNSSGPFYTIKLPAYEMVSLVEKGHRLGASSNSSCCSSDASSACVQLQQSSFIDDTVMQRCMSELRETKIDNKCVDNDKVSASAEISLDSNENGDCIVVMNPENDDITEADANTHVDNQDQQATTQTSCGHLELALLYDAPVRKMTVHILQARLDHPPPDHDQPTHTQVRLILLPNKKQKHKTKIRFGENPHYMDSFVLHRINPEDVNSMGIRVRLYSCEKMRRERIIGEATVSFAKINLELENHFWLNLQPKTNTSLTACTKELASLTRSDSTGSRNSIQHGGVPELLLGLCYNATTGRLGVEVVKGSHFSYLLKNVGGITRAPDTYVKLNLVSSTGQELAHSKTTIRRGQPNPLFKEIFVFQVALFQLADVTLMVVVYNRKGVTKKKEMLGWFSLGLNSSGAEELAHWMDMKEYQQEQLFRWHVLVQS